MQRFLFLVSIGPVQEFIAGARRTRDLWFGSWMLSELSRVAAQAVQDHGGQVQLIFPPPQPEASGVALGDARNDADLTTNVANKILAIVTVAPKTLGTTVKEKVKKRLQEMWSTAQQAINGDIDQAAAQQQIDDLLEIYWTAVRLDNDEQYASARKRAEALMAARKTTRDFASVAWGNSVPKSSIDGQRESVIPEHLYPTKNDPQRDAKINRLYQMYKVRPAERLSGVDLLKRHGQPAASQNSFPSTSDVSVRAFLHRIQHSDFSAKAKAAWATYLSALKSLAGGRLHEERVRRDHPIIGTFDGGLLLESRLYELIDDRNEREMAGKALSAFYNTLDLPRPEPYYAILLADGDRMGATIDHQASWQQHVALSQRLKAFAGAAQEIVTEHDGALIYAGGDDVLAFVPLHTLLACAQALHDHFAALINPPKQERFTDKSEQERFTDKDGKAPTLSVGMVICHHLEPLSDALNLARQAERAAKDVDGKNALAIVLSKRSGADVTVSGTWGMVDQDLEHFGTMHRLDTLPDGAAFQLRDLAERLTPRRGESTLPPAAIIAEAQRIIGRKQPQHGNDMTLAKETREAIHAALERWIAAQTSDTNAALTGLRAFADALIVARALAVAAEHANVPIPAIKEEA